MHCIVHCICNDQRYLPTHSWIDISVRASARLCSSLREIKTVLNPQPS